jgi:DNA-binding winged helix-turn-helix (wHTH) protein
VAQLMVANLAAPTQSTWEPSQPPQLAARYCFGEFRLCSAERRLWRNGEPVRLTPRALDLLLALVQSPGRVVGREELLRSVWGEVSVQDSNLTVNLCLLRRALGDAERLIATVPGRGYQFVAPVRLEWPQTESSPAPVWLAVAPFQALAPAPERPGARGAFPGAALGSAAIEALASVPGLRVRASSAGLSLAVDWLLEGFWQELDGAVRIAAQLVRTLDGGIGWAGHRDFAAAPGAEFELQDRVGAWLAHELGRVVARAE